MPLMNLLTSLVRFNHMYEEHKRSDSREDDTVLNKKKVIEVKTNEIKQNICVLSFQDLLFEVHQVESEVLSINCNISGLTYKLVNWPNLKIEHL